MLFSGVCFHIFLCMMFAVFRYLFPYIFMYDVCCFQVFVCIYFLCMMYAVFRCLFPYIFLCDVCCFQVFVSIYVSM